MSIITIDSQIEYALNDTVLVLIARYPLSDDLVTYWADPELNRTNPVGLYIREWIVIEEVLDIGYSAVKANSLDVLPMEYYTLENTLVGVIRIALNEKRALKNWRLLLR